MSRSQVSPGHDSRSPFVGAAAATLLAGALAGACAAVDEATPSDSAAEPPAALLTESEWLERSGPQPGPHGVVSQACEGEAFDADYRVTPTVECAWRLDAEGQRTAIRDCGLRPYCTLASDCSEQPWGSCVGVPSSQCRYPAFEPEAACESDADCTFAPEGECAPSLDDAPVCYPTGECRQRRDGYCNYRGLDWSCDDDADCQLAEGGRCERLLLYTTCRYDACRTDADCGPGARCDCQGVGRCVEADCFTDADCGGFACSPSPALQCGNLDRAASYRCRTPEDECETDQGCLERCEDGECQETCLFDPAPGAWVCRSSRCTVP
jgi:hypothetical protein